jgi:hypothetical protein
MQLVRGALRERISFVSLFLEELIKWDYPE